MWKTSVSWAGYCSRNGCALLAEACVMLTGACFRSRSRSRSRHEACWKPTTRRKEGISPFFPSRIPSSRSPTESQVERQEGGFQTCSSSIMKPHVCSRMTLGCLWFNNLDTLLDVFGFHLIQKTSRQ